MALNTFTNSSSLKSEPNSQPGAWAQESVREVMVWPMARSQKELYFPPCPLSWLPCSRRSQPSSCEATHAAVRWGPCSKKLTSCQQQSWKQILQPQWRVLVTRVQADVVTETSGEIHRPEPPVSLTGS